VQRWQLECSLKIVNVEAKRGRGDVQYLC
jgi:hypothetical protein